MYLEQGNDQLVKTLRKSIKNGRPCGNDSFIRKRRATRETSGGVASRKAGTSAINRRCPLFDCSLFQAPADPRLNVTLTPADIHQEGQSQGKNYLLKYGSCMHGKRGDFRQPNSPESSRRRFNSKVTPQDSRMINHRASRPKRFWKSIRIR